MNSKNLQGYNLIIFWYQNDWGYFYRRNEALTRQFSTYKNIKRIIHVEPPNSLIALGRLLYKSFFERDKHLRLVHQLHLKKSLSPYPIWINEKLLVFNPIVIFPNKIARSWYLADQINRLLFEKQLYGIWRRLDKDAKTLILFYPPQNYTQSIMSQADQYGAKIFVDLVDDQLYNRKVNGADDSLLNRMKDSYTLSLEKASKIFSVAKDLANKYGKLFDREIMHISNGVDENQGKGSSIHSSSSRNMSPKKVVYVGQIAYSLNLNIAEEMFVRFPNVKFIFVGPISKKVRNHWHKLRKKNPNLSLVGPKIHDDAVKYIEEADVLVHFNNPAKVKGFDSMKLYEYLITGKPVVTTPVPPSNKFSELVYVADRPEWFSNQLGKALHESNRELQKKRRNAARSHSWARKAKKMWEAMTNL